jgi:DNA-binding MarR family transcriptional regulator
MLTNADGGTTVTAMNASAELLEALCWELRRSFRDLLQAAELELAPLGITASDRAILEFLARETAPVSLSELARKTSVSRQHIHQSIRRLPDPGWVESVASPDDHRIVLLRLTREGRAFWKKVRAVDQRFFAPFARRFRSEELRSAVSALQKLRGELQPTLDAYSERS